MMFSRVRIRLPIKLSTRMYQIMEIEISAAESLGVRGMCCVIRTGKRCIVIDPGLALGYRRNGFLPHPVQVAAGEDAKLNILKKIQQATDIVISHLHGDHVPLAEANPYQMSLESVSSSIQQKFLWINEVTLNSVRALEKYRDLCATFGCPVPPSAGQTHGCFSFSRPVLHGSPDTRMGTVMMTRIEDGNEVFVHASDIQLLSDVPVSLILDWEPSILLVSGPPIYRGLPGPEAEAAWNRARMLSDHIEVCIIDHHLFRCEAGVEWLNELRLAAGGEIMCAADFMSQPRRLLEARRAELYDLYPVPPAWHEQYALGTADTSAYRNLDLSRRR